MAATDPHLRRLAARAGAATKNDRPEAADLRRELAEERIAAAIRKVVDTAPPLTSAQVDRLRGLLRPAPSAAGDAA